MQTLATTVGIFLSICTALSITWADDTMQAAGSGNPVADAPDNPADESTFLHELHYSHEDFLRIYESLPKDDADKVDWALAIEQGLISPAASIDDENVEEVILDMQIVINFDDMLVRNVVFSHEIHTYWLNCESCHPKLFIPKVGANPMTMTDIRQGKYCGLCHGAVAFPTNVIDAPNFRANCLRCHRANRG